MRLISTPPPRLLQVFFGVVCGECSAFLGVAGEVHHHQDSIHTVNLEPPSLSPEVFQNFTRLPTFTPSISGVSRRKLPSPATLSGTNCSHGRDLRS